MKSDYSIGSNYKPVLDYDSDDLDFGHDEEVLVSMRMQIFLEEASGNEISSLISE